MAKEFEKKEFRIPSDLGEVPKASAAVLEFLKPLSLSEGAVFDIRLSLEEGLINAMKYGNQLRRSVPVRLEVEYSKNEVRLSVEDQGPGFDLRSLKDCTSGENILETHGRGVYLIRRLMDRVAYNEKGNRLTMTKFLTKRAAGG